MCILEGGLDYDRIDLFPSIHNILIRSCEFLLVASYFVNVPVGYVRTVLVDEPSWNIFYLFIVFLVFIKLSVLVSCSNSVSYFPCILLSCSISIMTH